MSERDPSPAMVTLTAEDWLSAAVVGALRVARGDRYRAADRDRGAAGNALADLQGAIGEIAALKYLAGRPEVRRLAHDTLNCDGPVDAVDVIANQGDADEYRLEIKCEMLAPHKRLMLINARSHERSQRRGAQRYLALLTTIGADVCAVGRSIRLQDVDDWPVRCHGAHRDPAHTLPLAQLTPRWFGSDYGSLSSRLYDARERAISVRRLDEVFDCREALMACYAAQRERPVDAPLAALTTLLMGWLDVVNRQKEGPQEV